MRISKLIANICEQADAKFAGSNHLNDAVSVSIYSSGLDWQISLQQPTQKQLDNGEIAIELLHTVKKYEYRNGFFVSGPTLLGTLRELQNRVHGAVDWEQ